MPGQLLSSRFSLGIKQFDKKLASAVNRLPHDARIAIYLATAQVTESDGSPHCESHAIRVQRQRCSIDERLRQKLEAR